MKPKLKIVLADRDNLFLSKLKSSLERKGDMMVVGSTGFGSSALELIKQTKADILIMDILLGQKDGFWLLDELQNLNCIVIIVSAMDSDALVRRAIGLGASYYMAKPIHGDLLIERIYQLVGAEEMKPQKILYPAEHLLSPIPETEVDLESEISIFLSRMGISASIKGYHFIRCAVIMAIEEPDILNGITKSLYPDVGKIYKTSASKVERAIRHAIESAWKKNGQQVYFEVAGYFAVNKPTNGQFIAVLSEYFRMKYCKSAS